MPYKKNFLYCEKCGKKLIERLPNGLFKFIFGKKSSEAKSPPVNMKVHGSVQMVCIRRSCGHTNTFNYFPTNQPKAENSGKIENKE